MPEPLDYSLGLYTPAALGAASFGNVEEWASGWRRSWNMYLGCKRGSFRLYPDKGHAVSDLKQVFYEWLGYHFEEHAAGLRSWGGLLYSMDFCHNGNVKRRSLEHLANAVKSIYINDSEVYAETSYYTDASSIAWYGRKEAILEMDGFAATAAETMAQTHLMMNKKPWPHPVSIGGDDTYVEVNVLGYAATVNWLYLTAADGTTDNANDWISEMLAADVDLVTAGKISTNTIQVKQTCNVSTRVLDKMHFIASLGDSSYHPWQVYVDQHRELHYRAVDLTVKYYRRQGRFYNPDGSLVNPWLMEPGVIRDTDYPAGIGDAGDPLLESVQDSLIEEIEVGSDGSVSLRGSEYDGMEILSEQAEYEKMLADEAAQEAEENAE